MGGVQVGESSAQRIDPRFDPRFQRGYVPGETGGSSASDASPDPAAPTPATSPAETGAADAPPAPSRGAADAPPAPSRAGARTSVASGEASAQGAGAGAVAERPAPAGPGAESAAEVVSWFDEPEPEPDPPSADPWFLGAWTVSVVAFALGATLVLAGIMSEGYYGTPNESERWLQIVGWTVAPSLMQGGLLGIVVVLVWTGLRHARRAEAHAEAPS
jgi:hypothetical protein